MNIEVGKFYRMRCGGAVRIESINQDHAYGNGLYDVWHLNGEWIREYNSTFDLIAEISESEYNRIIAGEAGGSSKQVEALQDEVNALKRTLSEMYETNLKAFEKQQDERRFEAAKSAMNGICANQNNKTLEYEEVVKASVKFADALLKALEVKS